MSSISKKNSGQSTTKTSSQQKQQLNVPRSFLAKNGTLRIAGVARPTTNTPARMRRSVNTEEMQVETEESGEPVELIEDDQDPNTINDDDEDDEEEQQEEPMNDESADDDMKPPPSTITPKRTGQQQIHATRTPIPRTPEQRMSSAMLKLKDPNLHLRTKDELSAEETKAMDAEWLDTPFGIPKHESQVKYTSPTVIMLDDSEKSRGFGGRWWFGVNARTGEKIERLTIQQYATRLQPLASSYAGNINTKKISLSKNEVAQLVKKLPDIMDDYVKSGETFNYMYEKAVQERMKREFVTGTGNGRNGGHGSGGRYYGPSSSSWFR